MFTTMSSPMDAPVDSKEGIEMLARWARAGGFVLDQFHEDIAEKYGVSLDGVAVARALPLN